MSDTKLRPEDLTSGLSKHEVRHAIDVLREGATHLEQVRAAAMLENWWTRRDSVAPAPAPEKVCGVLHAHRLFSAFGACMDCGEPAPAGGWPSFAEPAPTAPEPAAPEMPGRKGWSDDPSWIVDCAATELRRLAALSREGIRNTSEDWPETCASRLENLWRNLAQPVAVGMTEELEVVLRLAAQYVEGWRQTYQSPEYREQMLTAIAAVRQQAAQGRKVEFPKGRELVSMVRSLTPYLSQLGCTDLARSFNDYADASATELDAAEGKSEGRG